MSFWKKWIWFISMILLLSLFIMPTGKAVNADKFLVMNDGGCTPTLIATTGGCWSLTSGGAGGAGVPGSTDRALLDGNSGNGAGNLNANMNVKDWCTSSACNGGTNFAGTINMLTSTITIQRNWNSNGGTMVIGTSTVVFAGSGTLSTKNNGAYGVKDLYNVTINAGVLTTFDTFVGVANILRIDGSLLSSAGDPQRVFSVFGVSGTSTPVIVGAFADLSQSGYLYYSVESTSNFDVVGTTYQHLGVRGAPNISAYQTADITTPNCGVYLDCAMLINAIVPHTRFTYYTNSHKITVGGNFWVGDGALFPATIHAGSSRIEAYGINPIGPGIAYWESATLIAHPSQGTLPFFWGYYQTGGSLAYLQSASLTTTDSEIHISDTSIFYVNTSSFNFNKFTIEPDAHFFKNGFDISNLQFFPSSGYSTITTWLTNSRPNRVQWNMSMSDSTADFTVYIGNMTLGSYLLSKDGAGIVSADANGIGTISFVFKPGNTAVHTWDVQVDPQQIQLLNYGWLLGFFALLTLGLIGAFEIKKRRGH